MTTILNNCTLQLTKRPRRNRRSAAIRSLVEETVLRPADLVACFFLLPGASNRQEISSMPGVASLSADLIVREVEKLHARGVPAVALFPVISPEQKDPQGLEALREEGSVPLAIQLIKKEIPSLCVITDIALDAYTSHGHDGWVGEDGQVLNDESVEILSQMALLHAQSGVDFVAPSDMMDGRVGAIRKTFDQHAFHNVGIISYAAKYVSGLYGPYRDTLQSHVKFGDKKGYQMNPANVREALIEAALDEEEGADGLMVKPALYYLDIIAKLRAHSNLPISAFHVSGEYGMVMAAHERGFLDAERVFCEALLAIKRAGADFIFTYAAPKIIDRIT